MKFLLRTPTWGALARRSATSLWLLSLALSSAVFPAWKGAVCHIHKKTDWPLMTRSNKPKGLTLKCPGSGFDELWRDLLWIVSCYCRVKCFWQKITTTSNICFDNIFQFSGLLPWHQDLNFSRENLSIFSCNKGVIISQSKNRERPQTTHNIIVMSTVCKKIIIKLK